MVKPIKLHWARSKPNFGDMLSPLIVERVAGRPVVYAKTSECDLVAIGSLMQRLKEHWWNRRVHVWGAGFIGAQKQHASRHIVHAVRGPETAALINKTSSSVALGDPALLADRLDEKLLQSPKKHRLSIIPHYKDQGTASLASLIELNPKANVIDVFSDPLAVLREIAASELVLSSAMHGLIAADSLQVPNYRISLSESLRGGDFKFNDYYGALGLQPEVLPMQAVQGSAFDDLVNAYARPGIEKVKENLQRSFPVDI